LRRKSLIGNEIAALPESSAGLTPIGGQRIMTPSRVSTDHGIRCSFVVQGSREISATR
jgi:hypothetical protein